MRYLMLALLSCATLPLFAQQPAPDLKTVAIRSARNTFFSDYPIDSLVKHLRVFKENPGIQFYRSTEDDTRTGFYADYLVDIDFDIKFAHLEPQRNTGRNERLETMPVYRRNESGTLVEGQRAVAVPAPAPEMKMEAGNGYVVIRMRKRAKNARVKKQYFKATSFNDDELRFQLIIAAMNHLLDEFDKK